MNGRELHRHVLGRIEKELRGRSWNWLAEASGVPQSTLAYQKARPRFSLKVLVCISRALKRSPAYFLPPQRRERLAAERVDVLMGRIQSVLEDYEKERGA